MYRSICLSAGGRTKVAKTEWNVLKGEFFHSVKPFGDAGNPVKSVIGLLGYACISAYFVIVMFSDVFSTAAVVGPVELAITRVAFTCGVLTSLLVGMMAPQISSKLFKSRGVLLSSYLVTLAVPVLIVLETIQAVQRVDLWVVSLCWAFLGFATCFIEKHYVAAISSDDIRSSEIGAIIKGIMAGVIAIICSCLVFPVNVIVIVLLPGIALAIVWPLTADEPRYHAETLDRTQMMQRFDSPKSGILLMVCNGLVAGLLGFILSVEFGGTDYAMAAFGCFTILGAAVFALIVAARQEVLTIRALQLFLLPLFIGCFILAMLFDGVVRVAMVIVAFVATQTIQLVDIALMSHASKVRDLPAAFCFSMAQLPIMGGVAVGWGFGGLFFSSDQFGSLPLNVFLCVILVVFASVVVLDNERKRRIEKAAIHEKAAEQKPPIELKCEKLATEYMLTDREAEILEYLAKGRNTDYISSELFLAKPTVKTHIHHVYDKTGVHNQQDLISLVESVRI